MKKDKIIKQMEEIGRTLEKTEKLMIDTDHDKIDWKKAFTWLGIISFGIYFWWRIFTYGFFTSIIWLIVLAAIVALGFKIKEMMD